MGLEIERKFLVQGDDWKSLGTPVLFHQGYLNRNPERSVRVRIEGDMAKLNIKAPVSYTHLTLPTICSV